MRPSLPEHPTYILWGSSGHSNVLAEVIHLRGGKVVALFDNDSKAISTLPGVPIYYGDTGLRNWLAANGSINGLNCGVAIGGSRGKDRQDIYESLSALGLTFPSIIHPSAVVSLSATFADGCQILANAVISASVSIGRMCIVNNNANIDHDCKIENGVHIAPGAILCGCVHVGNNTMIGAGAVVLPRIRIEENSVVGAGAVVTKNVPSGSVVVGNPARVIRSQS